MTKLDKNTETLAVFKKLDELFGQFVKVRLREKEIEDKLAAEVLELEEACRRKLAKIPRSSAQIKDEIKELFLQYKQSCEAKGETFQSFACNYGKLGIKENRPSVSLAKEESEIIQLLELHALGEYLAVKKSLNKQLILRKCADDKEEERKLQRLGISTEQGEDFYLRPDKRYNI